MKTVDRKHGHAVIGPVHRVEPSTDSTDELRDTLEHERRECGALRVLIDLTSRTDLTDEEIGVLVEYVGADGERWTVRLATDARPELIGRLCDAGLDGHLIQDSGVLDLPHQVGRED